MNKYILTLSLLVSISSVQAMDTTSRVLVGSSAVVCGLAGNVGAQVLITRAAQHLQDASAGEFTTDFGSHYSYPKAKKNYIRKAAIGGALRTSSCISALLLGRYAYNNVLPTNNAQTYASLLAVAAGGALCQSGFALENLNRQGSPAACALIFGGGALALAGAYGVLKS